MVFERPKIIIGFILLSLFKEVYTNNCPDSCQCNFSSILEENLGTCELSKALVNITWKIDYREKPKLLMICEGSNFQCTELPQFDIGGQSILLDMTSCDTNLLRCFKHITVHPTEVQELVTHNMTTRYKDEDFKELSKLQSIEIHFKDSDTEIPEVVLSSFPAILTAKFHGGQLILKPNMFRKINSFYLTLNENKIKVLPSYTFNGTKLTKLVIAQNDFKLITAEALQGIPNLSTLIIRDNKKLQTISPKAFTSLKNLDSVELTKNALNYLANGLFRGMDLLVKVSIKYNLVDMKVGTQLFARTLVSVVEMIDCKIHSLPEGIFKKTTLLKEIDFSKNMIEILPPKIFSTNTYLEKVCFKKNKIKVLPKGIFSKLKHLRDVNFSDNNIIELTGNLFHFKLKNTNVWFDNNNMTVLNFDVFNNTNLTTLSLSFNRIEHIFASDSISLRLQRLNLSNNNINKLDEWMVESKRLVPIRIAKKTDIDFSDDKVEIDMRNNVISTIIKHESDPKTSMHAQISLSSLLNNSLDCNCTAATILNKWQKDGILMDFGKIICSDNQHLAKINALKLCDKTHAMIGRVGFWSICAVILFIIIMTIFSSRNNIWKYVKTYFNRNTENLNTHQCKLDAEKSNDIFITFAHQDGEFVSDQLLPKLEEDFDQKVSVHYRDWIVGELIPDQIIKSVESSRMTLMVLTEHFLASEWMYLEFRTAHNLGIQEGRPKLIIIVLDEAVVKDLNLPDDLKSYISLNGYLLWSDSNFWKKLQSLLSRQGKKQKQRNGVANKLSIYFS